MHTCMPYVDLRACIYHPLTAPPRIANIILATSFNQFVVASTSSKRGFTCRIGSEEQPVVEKLLS